jgi:hypothetical protein
MEASQCLCALVADLEAKKQRIRHHVCACFWSAILFLRNVFPFLRSITMDPFRKYTVQSNILQIEETFRDAMIKAHEERYRKLRDEVAKLMSETPAVSQLQMAVQGATQAQPDLTA